jgi:hypothetical protein
MGYTDYSPDEIVSRGEAIYERQIRPRVELDNQGKYVIIDVETGEYELDDDDAIATTRALVKRPEAVLYGLRVGYPSAYVFGGGVLGE